MIVRCLLAIIEAHAVVEMPSLIVYKLQIVMMLVLTTIHSAFVIAKCILLICRRPLSDVATDELCHIMVAIAVASFTVARI